MQTSNLNRQTRYLRPVTFAAYETLTLSIDANESVLPATLCVAVYDTKSKALLAFCDSPTISGSNAQFTLNFRNQNVADLFWGESTTAYRDVDVIVWDSSTKTEWAQGHSILRQDLALSDETLPPIPPVADWVRSVNGKGGVVHLTAADIPYSDGPGSPNVDEFLLENANAIAAHVEREDNPHQVTAAQVGALPTSDVVNFAGVLATGKAADAYYVKQTFQTQANQMTALYNAIGGRLPASNEYFTLSLDDSEDFLGLKIADNAGVYWAAIATNQIVHNYSDGETHILSFPAALSGTIALTSQIPSSISAFGCASETWTFTVDDGNGGTTTVTKKVVVDEN